MALSPPGWMFYNTQRTKNYSYVDLLAEGMPQAIQILVPEACGSVRFQSPEIELEPGAGDTVVHDGPKRTAKRNAYRGRG